VEKQRRISWIRLVMRLAVLAMIGFAAVTVALGGLQAVLVLLPILAVHVAVALVAYALWIRNRRRRKVTRACDGDSRL